MQISSKTNILSPVLKSAKFTLKEITLQDRNEFIDKECEKFTYKILGEHTSGLSINKLQELVNKEYPNKKIEVFGLKNSLLSNIKGYTVANQNESKNAISFFEIHIISKLKEGISRKNYCIIIHELTHVLDLMTNTKKLARTLITENKDNKYSKLFEKFYSKTIYSYASMMNPFETSSKYLKNVEKKVREFAQKVPLKDSIDFLQMARYSTESEMLAYSEGYATDIRLCDSKTNNQRIISSTFLFPEKTQILKKVCAEKIAELRQLQRETNQTTKV